MRSVRAILALSLLLVLVTHAATATILHVPSPAYPTIQAGLNAAQSGDSVLVARGTYTENLFWPFRNGIVLIGAGMDSTIVVGDQVEAVVYMASSAIDSLTVLRGLSFSKGGDNGLAFAGASPLLEYCAVDSSLLTGIFCFDGSEAKIQHCRISGNGESGIALNHCGAGLTISDNTIGSNRLTGVSCSSSLGTISKNTIQGNATVNGSAGGVVCNGNPAPVLEGNTIRNNSAVHGAGGISCNWSSPLIVGNTLSENMSVSGCGGAIYCAGSSSVIVQNVIVDNEAMEGGGIACQNSSPTITGNRITANTARGQGGGVSCRSSSPAITGNTIAENVASGQGGAIFCYDCLSLTVANNAIRANAASYAGGGIYCESSVPMIEENEITENTAGGGGGISIAGATSVTIGRNRVADNIATSPNGHGGGIACSGTLVEIVENHVEDNSSSQSAGGIYCSASSLTMTGNCVIGNSAGSAGGVYIQSDSPMVERNTIAENVASFGNGGGILLHSQAAGSGVIVRNAIIRNRAAGSGGGASYTGSSVFSFNTVAENAAAGRGDGISTYASGMTAVRCNIAFNGEGFHNGTVLTIPLIQNNWWGDPSGPWHGGLNPSGLGDSLSTYAWDFIPWIAEAETAAPPIPPRNLQVLMSGNDMLTLGWEQVPLADLVGYRLYFDTDEPGCQYAEVVDVGNATEFSLEGLIPGVTYYLAVTCYDESNEESWFSREISAVPTASCVENLGSTAGTVGLAASFPNPFCLETTVRYTLPSVRHVRVAVYSTLGQHLATLVDGIEGGGSHVCRWRATDNRGRSLPAGIYLILLETEETTQIQKVVLIK